MKKNNNNDSKIKKKRFVECNLQIIRLDGGVSYINRIHSTNKDCVPHIFLHYKVMTVNLVIPVSLTLITSGKMEHSWPINYLCVEKMKMKMMLLGFFF